MLVTGAGGHNGIMHVGSLSLVVAVLRFSDAELEACHRGSSGSRIPEHRCWCPRFYQGCGNHGGRGPGSDIKIKLVFTSAGLILLLPCVYSSRKMTADAMPSSCEFTGSRRLEAGLLPVAWSPSVIVDVIVRVSYNPITQSRVGVSCSCPIV